MDSTVAKGTSQAEAMSNSKKIKPIALSIVELCEILKLGLTSKYNQIQNSPAVKKSVQPQKGHSEKRCDNQGGGQEMAVMVG